MGNIVKVQLGPSRTESFTYAAGSAGSHGLPLISSVVEDGVTRNVSYDAAGSEVSDGANTMAYGARELLGSAGPNFSGYAYDGFRRRVQTQTTSGQQRVSLYDGRDHLLAESAASATPSLIAYEYVWFGDRPIAQFDATATHWNFADHLGTPLAQTDNTGAISWQAEYEPYGQVYALRSGDVHQPLRFPGQEIQQFDTGANGINELTYNGTRWYRSRWGRYSASDTIRLEGGTNLYAYTGDDPNSAYDFRGMSPWWLPKIQCPKWGVDIVKANMGQTLFHRLDPFWFKSMVGQGQPWDFKAFPKQYAGVSPDDLDYTGNFNYGATGLTAGFSLSLLLAAGASPPKDGGHGPEPGGAGSRGFFGYGGVWPFGEKVTDAAIERDGYIYASVLLSTGIDLCAKKRDAPC